MLTRKAITVASGLLGTVALWLLPLFVGSTAYAHGDGYGMAGGGYGHHGFQSRSQSSCPIAEKALEKADFFLEHKTDLGLSEEQAKAIQDIQLQLQKDSIRQNADSQVYRLDLRSKLKEDKVDVEGTDALIDKGFASMASASKSNLDAYAKLKGILKPDQLAKLKELWKNKHSEKEPSSTKPS